MSKTSAIIQIIIILVIVGLSTYYFFKGNFEVGLAFLPFLMFYYVFITARRKRTESRNKDQDERP